MARRAERGTAEGRSVRLLKVGEQLRHILSELIARGDVHDPLLSIATISVTEVRPTPDLRQATVYVKPLLGRDEEAVIDALRRNTAFFQREVAARVRMKHTPKLRFRADESFEEGARIDALLRDPRVAESLEREGE